MIAYRRPKEVHRVCRETGKTLSSEGRGFCGNKAVRYDVRDDTTERALSSWRL